MLYGFPYINIQKDSYVSSCMKIEQAHQIVFLNEVVTANIKLPVTEKNGQLIVPEIRWDIQLHYSDNEPPPSDSPPKAVAGTSITNTKPLVLSGISAFQRVIFNNAYFSKLGLVVHSCLLAYYARLPSGELNSNLSLIDYTSVDVLHFSKDTLTRSLNHRQACMTEFHLQTFSRKKVESEVQSNLENKDKNTFSTSSKAMKLLIGADQPLKVPPLDLSDQTPTPSFLSPNATSPRSLFSYSSSGSSSKKRKKNSKKSLRFLLEMEGLNKQIMAVWTKFKKQFAKVGPSYVLFLERVVKKQFLLFWSDYRSSNPCTLFLDEKNFDVFDMFVFLSFLLFSLCDLIK